MQTVDCQETTALWPPPNFKLWIYTQDKNMSNTSIYVLSSKTHSLTIQLFYGYIWLCIFWEWYNNSTVIISLQYEYDFCVWLRFLE